MNKHLKILIIIAVVVILIVVGALLFKHRLDMSIMDKDGMVNNFQNYK